MDSWSQACALLLGAVYLAAAVLPCPTPGLDRTRPIQVTVLANAEPEPAPAAHDGHHHHHEHAEAEAPVVAPVSTVQIPCPCGCGERATAATFGRLGPSIVSLALVSPPLGGSTPAFTPAPAPVDEPLRLLDPIPI
jgi:hypothetical protein